jgi:hypothetical protein
MTSTIRVNQVESLDGLGRGVYSYPYQSGIEITSYETIIRDGDMDYRLSGSTILPYTTTGEGMPEGGSFVTVGDALLRQDLATDGSNLVTVATATGSENISQAINRRTLYVNSISDLQDLSAEGLVDGQEAHVKEFTNGAGFGGGHFVLEEDNTETPDGIEVVEAPTGNWVRLSRSKEVEVSVGPGGDFSSLNDAIKSATSRHYSSGQSVTILLKSGFVWDEQVFVDGINLGAWRIISEDAEVTIQGSSLGGSAISTRHPALCALNGGTTPRVGIVMNMDNTGAESLDTVNILAYNGGSIYVISPGGLKNASWANAFVSGGGFINLDRRFAIDGGTYNVMANEAGAMINADKCNLSGAGFAAAYALRGAYIYAGADGGTGDQLLISSSGPDVVRAKEGSFIDVNSKIITGTGEDLVNAEDGSRVHMSRSTATNAPRYAVHAQRGSSITALDCDLSGAGNRAVEANSSDVDVSGSDCTGAGNEGVRSLNASVRARNVNARKGASNSPQDFVAMVGGIIHARGATGGFNVTPNEVSAAGIVFAD